MLLSEPDRISFGLIRFNDERATFRFHFSRKKRRRCSSLLMLNDRRVHASDFSIYLSFCLSCPWRNRKKKRQWKRERKKKKQRPRRHPFAQSIGEEERLRAHMSKEQVASSNPISVHILLRHTRTKDGRNIHARLVFFSLHHHHPSLFTLSNDSITTSSQCDIDRKERAKAIK